MKFANVASFLLFLNIGNYFLLLGRNDELVPQILIFFGLFFNDAKSSLPLTSFGFSRGFQCGLVICFTFLKQYYLYLERKGSTSEISLQDVLK